MTIGSHPYFEDNPKDISTEIRLLLPDASNNKYIRKRGKGNIRRLYKRATSIFPDDYSLAFEDNEVLYREGGMRSSAAKFRKLMDYLCDLVYVYPHIIQLGGEAVPILQPIASNESHPLKAMAIRLLEEIDLFTSSKFESRLSLVYCKQCLTSFSSHEIVIGRLSSTQLYACRTCQQSRVYYEGIKLILLLDDKMKDKWIQKDNKLYVNGFKQRKLIDFDEVIIEQATDKAVASFAIKVGNDTDAYRTQRYKNTPCTVMAGSTISENTMHMLERVFGRVQRNGAV
ncbi:MAG: hypothetical protein AAF564_23300 [Bacteroidota bacterium]